MKKVYAFLIGLAALAAPAATQACHLSYFHLISEQNLGGNVYEYTVEFCVGSGREGYNYGAVGYTGRWAVQLDNGAAFNTYPATATSPATGAVYLASLYYGSDILLYDDTYAAPGWDGTWACIEPSCGPISQVCYTFTFTTIGRPNTLTLMGAEGSGVGVVPYGCNGADDMMIRTNGPIADAGSDVSICAGSTASLSAAATGGSEPYSYLWDNGATTASVSVSPSSTTVYIVAITDNNGNTSYDAVSVHVNAAPTANAGPDRDIYIGYGMSCVPLNGTASGGTSPYTYQWNTGAQTPVINVCPTASTNYTLTVTDANGCSASDVASVNVEDIRCGGSKVYVCRNGRTKCIRTNQVNSYLNSGYTLGACNNRLDGDAVDEEEVPLRLFPNPSNDVVTVELILDETANAWAEIYAMDGRKVASEDRLGTMEEGNVMSFTMATNDLKPGVYLLVVTTDTGIRYTERLQVAH